MALLPVVVVEAIYATAAAMGLALAVILWRNRDKPGATALVVTSLAVAVWSGSLLGIALTGQTLSLGFLRTMYVGIVLVIVSAFVFALEYTGRERYVTKTTLALLSIHPVVTVALATVNPGGIFFPNIEQSVSVFASDSANIYGPAFHAHTLYSYLLLGGVAAMILDLLFRSDRPLYRGQAAALLLATVAPWGLNILTLFGPVEFDATPIGFIVATSLFTVALVRYRLIDITPIAREKLIDNVRDGMFVVDTDDQILDANQAYADLIGLSVEALVGADTADLFEGLPQMQAIYEELTAEPVPDTRQLSYSDRYVEVDATPIRDDRGRHVGWLFLVNDITELTQRERDLEQQIEKLDQFASIVSHDLRNPLNVAQGYVEHAQATGDDSHLPEAVDAMERMEAIIQDALALAREGEDVTEPDEISLAQTARAAWRNVDTAGATLATTDETIVADATRLQRLLENLFRNSIEHGVPDGEQHDHQVEVGVEVEGTDTVTVFIADNGVGIPDDKLDKVFEEGYTTNESGTGFGLAIVEQIASAHGWTVSATPSESGARFEIRGVARPVTAEIEG
jgi:PAS domain S-box-containing protein